MARPTNRGGQAVASPWANQGEKDRDRAAKREAVLRTAARFFNAKGYHATSLEDVALALHVTKPTIYHYFANKDEILFECTRQGLDGIAEAMRTSIAKGDTAADRLRAMLTSYALSMMDDYGICVARTQDHLLSPESRAKFRALKREIDALIRKALVEGQTDGSLATTNVRIAAFTAANALNGLGTWFDPKGAMSAAEIANLTVALLMDGLKQKET